MGKRGLLVADKQGNMDVIVFASMNQTEIRREVLESAGIETYGIVRVVSFVDVLLGGEHK